MTNKKEYYKEVCLCHNPECRKTFHQSEIEHIKVERLGQQVTEAVCPHCESIIHKFGLVTYPVDEFDLLYKNGIHRNTNKKLRQKLNIITNQIIAEDTEKYKQNIRNKKFVEQVNAERMAMA